MKKLLLFILPIIISSKIVYAQHLKVKHAFYAEAIGNGKNYSLNYERRIYNSTQVYMFLRAGISPTKYKNVTNPYLAPKFPIELNVVMRSMYEHMIECGLGVTPYLSREKAINSNGTSTAIGPSEFNQYYVLRLGYRYQPTESGMVFRIAITPLLADEDDTHISNKILPLYGVSLGYTF